MNTNILILILFIIVESQLLWYRYKPLYKILKTRKKEDITKTLANKQREDDLLLEKDRDLSAIDNYMEYIDFIIHRYNTSRNKKIARLTRVCLLHSTVKILPTISKYIQFDGLNRLDDKGFNSLSERDLMMSLESAYNDYSHENLECLNEIISIAIRLRDEQK